MLLPAGRLAPDCRQVGNRYLANRIYPLAAGLDILDRGGLVLVRPGGVNRPS